MAYPSFPRWTGACVRIREPVFDAQVVDRVEVANAPGQQNQAMLQHGRCQQQMDIAATSALATVLRSNSTSPLGQSVRFDGRGTPAEVADLEAVAEVVLEDRERAR